MRRILGPMILAGVACAVPAAALGLAQEQPKAKAARPAAKAPAKRPAMGTTTTTIETKVMVAPAKVAAFPAAVNMNLDAQKRQLTLQFTQQFRPIVKSEVHLIRSVCDLTHEQRAALARAGERLLEDAVAQLVDQQLKMMQGQPRPGGLSDPNKLIQDGVAAAVAANLSPEQAARYRAEVEARAADRKQVALHNLLAKLDHDLLLSDGQRDRIRASLAANWQDAWAQTLEMSVLYGDRFFPNIPDQYIVPSLSDAQRKIWQGTPKFGGAYWGVVTRVLGGDALEDDTDETREAAPKGVKDRARGSPFD